MRRLKLITVACLLVGVAIFSGCKDEKKENQPKIKVENETSLSQTVYADQTVGASEVKIVTTGVWISKITETTAKSAKMVTKAETVKWISITPNSGDAGSYTIIISLEPNITGNDRTATIAIICGDEEIGITVTQKAVKKDGTTYGDPPVLKTSDVSNVTATTATAGGNITDAGNPPFTERGVCYSATANPTVTSFKIAVEGNGTGSFDVNVTGLSPETTYYVRAYATNDNGTFYGNQVNFTTLSEKPDEYFEGSGTSGDPYQIGTAAQLAKLAELVNEDEKNEHYSDKYYILTADVNLGVNPYNTGSGWIPIGNNSSLPFKGVFDGNEKTITGLRINDSGLPNGGLFGSISGNGIAVCNLKLLFVNIVSSYHVGGIAADLGSGIISNCSVNGTISGSNFVGGMVGCIYNGSIINCKSEVSVNGSDSFIGGISGAVFEGSISNCTFTATVKGVKQCVGIVTGKLVDGNISNCSVSGSADGGTEVGGVAGKIENSGNIINCYVTGSISASGFITNRDNIGGIVGKAENGNIANCFTVSHVYGTSNIGGIVGLSDNSSVTNCYSMGWTEGSYDVGGVAGVAIGSGMITSCYTTGIVEGNDRVGGIVGNLNCSIENCVALNNSVKRFSSSGTYFKRISGYLGTDGILSNNVAWAEMPVINSTITSDDYTDQNGKDITSTQAKTQAIYEGLGWKFGNDDNNPWKWGGSSYPLPVLYWQTENPDMPGHLQ